MFSRTPHGPARAAIVAAALLLAAAPASAAKGRPAAATARTAKATAVRTGLENLEKQVSSFTLANGLTFIVVERHDAPVFSYQTVVNAGSANDQVGTTGLAHMMEHMAFKGTTVVGTTDFRAEKPLLDREEEAWTALLNERRKGPRADSTRLRALDKAYVDAQEASHGYVNSEEFSKVLEQAGAQDINAFTSLDITAYFYSIPSNRLELWALMEGGRMTQPVFREFYKERDVVYEERRMRTESRPIGRLIDEFIHVSYTAHPYGFGTIGFPSDLRSFSRTQGEAYFRAHYLAKNMTCAVVGDVTPAAVQSLAQTYFSGISDAPAPPPLDTVEPEQRAERRVLLEDPAQPFVIIGWHIPALTDPSYPAYKALADLLGGGDWARLNKALVKEQKIATQIEAFTGFPGEKYPSQLCIFVVPASGQEPERVERAVYAVLDSVQRSKPLTAEELAGYKVRIRAQKIQASESNASLAGELAQAQALFGDWHAFFREQERAQSLTVTDLMGAMSRTMTTSNRTVGMLRNSTAAAEGGR
jgi:predicted Zn-dependent peptidase